MKDKLMDSSLTIKNIHNSKVVLYRSKIKNLVCKILRKSPQNLLDNFGQSFSHQAKNEIEIMTKLRGKNHVIQIDHVKEDIENYYIFMEYCEGNLQDYINNKKSSLNEENTRELIAQCLYAIKECHDLNIIHGDIKLENYVLNNDVQPYIKLIDFGCSKEVSSQNELVSCNQGTPIFMSPESLESKLNVKSDIWAVGVMLYYMLVFKFPYNDYNSHYEIWRMIATKEIDFDRPELKKYGTQCVNFLRNILVKDYKQRLDVYQSLSHTWISHRVYEKYC
jgi:serine/threonine protein kinase